MTTTLILIQLLMGFVCAFLGVILMFHSGDVWIGFGDDISWILWSIKIITS